MMEKKKRFIPDIITLSRSRFYVIIIMELYKKIDFCYPIRSGFFEELKFSRKM